MGEFGGFMELIFSLLQTTLIFLTDNLNDISLINNLFFFDIKKNNILLKIIISIKKSKIFYLIRNQ